MDVKLTLKLDKEVIEQAKAYASAQGRSLSRIIEAYLRSLSIDQETEEPHQGQAHEAITPYVKSMATGKSIPLDMDVKGDYHKSREDKHR